MTVNYMLLIVFFVFICLQNNVHCCKINCTDSHLCRVVDYSSKLLDGGIIICIVVDDRSLGDELSALLRVIWSGKWAVVSPHQMLSAIWTKMSFFKGYTQHDAQEFLRYFPAENSYVYTCLAVTCIAVDV